MARSPKDDYPTRVITDNPSMPQGEAKNLVSGIVGTGTPLEQKWVNDDWGFKQAILKEADITPSGVTDTADDSQYLLGLKKIIGANFDTISDLVNTTTTFPSGTLVRTKVNNTDTNMGGADYRILTKAEYLAESQAGVTDPDGELIGGRYIGMDFYIGGGVEYVAKYNHEVGFDRAAGAIGDPRILGATHDDHPALQKLADWAKLNSPLDEGKIQKGYKKTFFHPRSDFYITEALDLRSSRTNYDFNQCTITPSGAHRALLWEGIFCSLSNLFIEGLINATRADWMASGEPLIEWGFEEPVNFSNGSQVTFEKVLARGGYDTFLLNSENASNASFIWGSNFKNCYFQDAVEYCFNFDSVFETSTTMTFDTCHARAITRDAVTVGAFDYFCIRHHVAASDNEPNVGVNWEQYWTQKPTTASRGTWTLGTQYLSNAKGFYFYNVNTLSMLGCSMDGGTNTEDGTVVNYIGQYIYIDRFHLESSNHDEVNDNRMFMLQGDFKFEELSLFMHRFNLPLPTDEAYFVGGGRTTGTNNARGTFLCATNKAPDGVNVPVYLDCVGFKSVDLGSGIPLNSVLNPSGSTTAQRGISKRIVKQLTSGTSTVAYTPDARENGAIFQVGDALAAPIFNVTLDNLLYEESNDWNANPQFDTYQFDFTLVGFDGTETINFIAGAGSPTFVGVTNYVGGGTFRATKITGTKWYVERLTKEREDGWFEYIPTGTYTSGSFNLPSSKTLDDIEEIRLTAESSDVRQSVVYSFSEGGVGGTSNIIAVAPDPVNSISDVGVITFGDGTSTSGTVSVTGSTNVLGASVRFKV